MSGVLQRTLGRSLALAGRGLHTGEECRVALSPAEPDSGVLFCTPEGDVRAHVGYVADTRRGTTLRCDGAEVQTVEHLLAALYGMSVQNAVVEVTGPEIPAVDGSALPWVELIESAGVVEQSAEAQTVEIAHPVWVADGIKSILAFPEDRFRASVFISFDHPVIGEQAVSLLVNPSSFREQIAPARTFCTSDEIEAILSQGLGRGGGEDNVVVAYQDRCSVPLRFADEFVRHKMLDLIGDLALIGGLLHADVTAIRPSHALNVATASKIVEQAPAGRQGG